MGKMSELYDWTAEQLLNGAHFWVPEEEYHYVEAAGTLVGDLLHLGCSSSYDIEQHGNTLADVLSKHSSANSGTQDGSTDMWEEGKLDEAAVIQWAEQQVIKQ